MSKTTSNNPADYIVPLNINGLEGRMLKLPAKPTKQAAGKEVMFVYGHHSSLERWWGIAQLLSRYGNVTIPDLPGFGGMDSFYTIGKKPTIDNLADYLAAFIKLRYRQKKVMIVGMSFGFVIVTRMFQLYPELADKVTYLLSFVGFSHKDDFKFSKTRMNLYLYGAKFFSIPPIAWLLRHIAFSSLSLRYFYRHTPNAKPKFAVHKTKIESEAALKEEIRLWHINDVRTWLRTTVEFLQLDNTKAKVDLPLINISSKDDHYFDNRIVEQHLKVIFPKVDNFLFSGLHAPTILADEKEAAKMIPPDLRSYIARHLR